MSRATLKPFTNASPASGAYKPVRILIKVLLPESEKSILRDLEKIGK
jgi:hypothetical protein